MAQAPADSSLTGLDAVAASLSAEGAEAMRARPPLERWNPPHCGEIDIRIDAGGRWWHEGSAIDRPALVRLFASVLRLDPDGYHLVTPAEKLRITVEDAPFLAVAVQQSGDALVFTTNVGDRVAAGRGHPLAMRAHGGGAAPYLEVRRGLLARLTRPVFYDLVGVAERRETAAGGELGVWSEGWWFALGPAPEL